MGFRGSFRIREMPGERKFGARASPAPERELIFDLGAAPGANFRTECPGMGNFRTNRTRTGDFCILVRLPANFRTRCPVFGPLPEARRRQAKTPAIRQARGLRYALGRPGRFLGRKPTR